MSALDSSPRSGAPWRLPDVLGVGNTALIVTGLMLPVGGSLARIVTLSAFADPVRLAVTLPAGELAAFGVLPITLVVAGFAAARLVREQARGMASRAIWIIVALLAVPVTLLEQGSVAVKAENLLIFGLTAIAVWIVLHEDLAPIRGGRLAVFLIAMYAVASIAYGLSARLGPAVTVTSTAPDVLPSGAYIRIAEDADWLFVTPCASRGTVLEVPKSAIAGIAWTNSAAEMQVTGDIYDRCP